MSRASCPTRWMRLPFSSTSSASSTARRRNSSGCGPGIRTPSLRCYHLREGVRRTGGCSVENVYRALSGLMRAAVRDRIIASSPCEDVELPRKTKVEVVPPTVAQVAALLDAMPERYRILGTLAASVGLRQGEALGLGVDRIDFLRRTLRVDRQLITISGEEPRYGPPKSDASAKETLDVYAHLWPESDDLTRAAIQAAFASARVPFVSQDGTGTLPYP